MRWLVFTLVTVISWGLYGILLHHGQTMMVDAKGNALYKSFLFVGIAYFLTAVLAPIGILIARGADWNYPMQGMTWSLIAGIAGALGAFCVLLAFSTRQAPPPVVMSIVFGGAPIVTAFANIILHPPANGFAALKPQFILGILLAAIGGLLVTLYRPDPPKPHAPAPPAQVAPTPAKAE